MHGTFDKMLPSKYVITLIPSHPGNKQALINMRARKNLIPPLPDDLCKPRESFPTSTPRDFQNARSTPPVVRKQTYKEDSESKEILSICYPLSSCIMCA